MSNTVIASDRARLDIGACYDKTTGTLDRRIFSDQGVYEAELDTNLSCLDRAASS